MSCSNQGCNASRTLTSNRGLCINCDKLASMTQRRYENSQRQSQARLQSQSSHRMIDSSLSPVQELQQQQQTPSYSSGHNQARAGNMSEPLVNVSSLRESYHDLVASGTESKILTDMYAMMLQIVSRQDEADKMKEEVQKNTERITELEKKIGDSSEIAERLGIVIRNLSLPGEGKSELQHVREALSQIGAPGLDVVRDVIKAIRFGKTNTYLGVVKVEISNEEARKIIMSNKKNLSYNRNEMIRNLIIQNLKPQSQFYSENLGKDLLKLIPGGNEVYISNNGRLRQRDHRHQTNGNSNGMNQNNVHGALSHPPPPRVSMPSGNNAQLNANSEPFQGGVQGQQVPMVFQQQPLMGVHC